MANTGLASSKNALFFAGGVIACAAIAAVTLGNQFTPQAEGAQSSELGSAVEQRSQTDASETAPDAASESDSVFGEYEGFADEADFIDDTSGFDTTPTDSVKVTIDENAQDDSQADSSKPLRSVQRAPKSGSNVQKSFSRPNRATNRQSRRAPKTYDDIDIIEQ